MLCFGGNTSVLKSDYYPPLDTSTGEWEIGLISFTSCNSIPNVESGFNNELHYYTSNRISDNVSGPEVTLNELSGKTWISNTEWVKYWHNVNLRTKGQRSGEEEEPLLGKRSRRATTAPNSNEMIMHKVSLPTGSFEFHTIADLLAQRLMEHDIDFELTVDPSTLKCILLSSAKLDF